MKRDKRDNFGYTGNILSEARVVVDALGGGDDAYNLILETASAESSLGFTRDSTTFAGMGVCQFDLLPFNHHKRKAMKFRDKILSKLGVDIELIEWTDLRYNSFLSLLFCRLYYLSVPKSLPSTEEGRAKYWKKYYNTFKGKGTVEHYLRCVQKVEALAKVNSG